MNSEACIPLSFSPGEAFHFDWSTEHVVLNDEVVTVKVAHFTLCYSGKTFASIYPNETQEMVFDAQVRVFEFFGGTVHGELTGMLYHRKKTLSGKPWKRAAC